MLVNLDDVDVQAQAAPDKGRGLEALRRRRSGPATWRPMKVAQRLPSGRCCDIRGLGGRPGTSVRQAEDEACSSPTRRCRPMGRGGLAAPQGVCDHGTPCGYYAEGHAAEMAEGSAKRRSGTLEDILKHNAGEPGTETSGPRGPV